MPGHDPERKVPPGVVVSGKSFHKVGHDETVLLDDTAIILFIRVVGVVVEVIERVACIGIERSLDLQLVGDRSLRVESPQKAVVIDVGGLFAENLHRIVPRKLVGTAQIIVAVGFIGTVERTLFDGAGQNRRSQRCPRHPVVLQVVAAHVGADLEPLGDCV